MITAYAYRDPHAHAPELARLVFISDPSEAPAGVEVVKLVEERAVGRLRAALSRQCDNMAFVTDRVFLPKQWLEKFERELAADRAILSPPPPTKDTK
jgi:hypothetical protein